MENQEILKLEIGTKESTKLTPERVKILAIKIEVVGEKKNEKLVCEVKHPMNEDPIHISSVKYENKGKLDNVGMWINIDDEGKIRKGSALAVLISYLNKNTPEELVGQEVETVEDDKGYLCFKAY